MQVTLPSHCLEGKRTSDRTAAQSNRFPIRNSDRRLSSNSCRSDNPHYRSKVESAGLSFRHIRPMLTRRLVLNAVRFHARRRRNAAASNPSLQPKEMAVRGWSWVLADEQADAAVRQETASQRRLRIMIVDDVPLILKLIRDVLEGMGTWSWPRTRAGRHPSFSEGRERLVLRHRHYGSGNGPYPCAEVAAARKYSVPGRG